MRQQYKNYRPSAETRELIRSINSIIARYQAAGYLLSVRQLYYQLVAGDSSFPNTEQSYKRVASIINDARIGGFIDWDAVEDRNRDIEMITRWNSPADIVDAAARSFHMDMWVGQPSRVFVIVEKAALAGVLERVCRQYDVPLLAARGYPSVSIIRELVLEHIKPTIFEQAPIIIHLGDHDPSGIDMTRDLEDRIGLFAGEFVEAGAYAPEVDRIALTMRQIKEKRPMPNPAKSTDARFAGYRRLHGESSWELDALDPPYLSALLESHIQRHIGDGDQWIARRAEVDGLRTELKATAADYRKKHGG